MSIIAREYFEDIQIPLVKQDEEICIQAIIIAKALEYKKPKEAVTNIISRHRTEFEGLIHSPNLGVSYRASDDVFLNERGIYHFCMLSRTPKAGQFRKWVSQILQIHRVQSLQSLDKSPLGALELVAKQMNMLVNHLKVQDDRIENLELVARTFAIDRFQRGEVKKQVQQLAYMVADIEGWKKPKRETFIKIWTSFNDHFGISSYHDLPKECYSKALELLSAWRERFNQELAIL